jgi:hypothetical protein
MARNTFTVHPTPRVLVHADDDQRKRVTVAGDTVVFGDSDVTFADNQGEIKDAQSKVLSTARFLISKGTSDVTVEDTDDSPNIKPPADHSAEEKTKRSKAAKKAAASKSKK